MKVNKVGNVSNNCYAIEKSNKDTGKRNNITAKTEAMLMASLMSLAALASCDIESIDASKESYVDLSGRKTDKQEEIWSYKDKYDNMAQVLYSSGYGRIREGDTSKGYKKMSKIARPLNGSLNELPFQVIPYFAMGEIYKFNLEEGSSGKYLLFDKDQGDMLFRNASLGVNASLAGFFIKATSTALYQPHAGKNIFSHACGVGYKHNFTDKLSGDVTFNNDFTMGDGVEDKEYNRSVEFGVLYKISDNANIKMALQKTYSNDAELDLDYSASFQTTF